MLGWMQAWMLLESLCQYAALSFSELLLKSWLPESRKRSCATDGLLRNDSPQSTDIPQMLWNCFVADEWQINLTDSAERTSCVGSS